MWKSGKLYVVSPTYMQKKPQINKTVLKTLSKKAVLPILELKNEVRRVISNDFDTSSQKHEYAVSRSIKNLVESGMIEILQSDNQEFARMTGTGRNKLHSITLEAEGALVSTTWDGFWRIILIDIPEERKSEREAVRYLLKKAGFVCLKNSAWISPFPYEHLFTNIKKDLGFTSEMIIFVTDKVDEETKKSLFELFGK